MKKVIYILAGLFISLSSCGPAYVTVQSPPPQQQPAEEVSYQAFYDDLSPYGQWIDYPGYGYVWMPDAGAGFKPYSTNGRWVYSDAGWVWASDYNWGWATFHYGRWFFEQGYGWMWVPGNEWAPAWVSWRRSDDYYGWAPLGPGVGAGASVSSYNPPSNYWSFVPHRYVNNPNLNNYYVNETKNVTIINNTTVINNTVINNNYNSNTTINNNARNNYYGRGPDANEVSRETGTTVRPVAITTSNRPGQAQLNNGQLSVFRPRVNAAPANANGSGNNNQQRIAPARVQSLNDIRMRNSNNNAPANNTRPANNEPAINRPAATTPLNATQNERPVNAPNNNPPANNNNQNQPQRNPVNNVQPATQNERPVTIPNNNPPVARPVNLPANTNNQNQQSRTPVNNPARPTTIAPVNNNSNNNGGHTTQPVQPQTRLNQRPVTQNQNQPLQQHKPPVVKPPAVNKDDKKDKPKPPPDHQLLQ